MSVVPSSVRRPVRHRSFPIESLEERCLLSGFSSLLAPPVLLSEPAAAWFRVAEPIALSVKNAATISVSVVGGLPLVGASGVTLSTTSDLEAGADNVGLVVSSGLGVAGTVTPSPNLGVDLRVAASNDSPRTTSEQSSSVLRTANLGVGSTVTVAVDRTGVSACTEPTPSGSNPSGGAVVAAFGNQSGTVPGPNILVTAGTPRDQVPAIVVPPGVPDVANPSRTVEAGFHPPRIALQADHADGFASVTDADVQRSGTAVAFFPLGLHLIVQGEPSGVRSIAEGGGNSSRAEPIVAEANLEAQPSDLLVGFAPFDTNPLSQAIGQFFDELSDLGASWLATISRWELDTWALAAVVAGVACEVARRQVRHRHPDLHLAGVGTGSVWFLELAGPSPGDEG
jgi:hypothetical protein